jgi:hypothetical protein
MQRLSKAVIPLLLSTPALATDWIVDATGTASSFTNITQAMAQVATGDRILVLPGNYPPFHFSRSVDVIGLGNSPTDVTIERVDFHPTIPTLGYDCAIVNVSIVGDSFSISGNELAPGTLVIDGVHLAGGVFLHGAGELYVLMQNSRIEAGAGDGFLGAAFDFGGGTLDVVDSLVQGAGASSGAGATAGVGLRAWSTSSSHVRIANSTVQGGAGVNAPGFQDGGDAIDRLGGGPVTLRLSGGSQVLGGDGIAPGRGGHAVDLAATITLGTATVVGGAGTPPGASFHGAVPTALGYDPYLALLPGGNQGQLPVFQHPGDFVFVGFDASLPSSGLAASLQIDPITTPGGSPLVGAQASSSASEAFAIPVRIHRVANPPPRRRVYYQGIFQDPGSGQPQTTNPVAFTIDP